MYRISDEEVQKVQAEYKRKYPPFTPYHFHASDGKLTVLAKKLLAIFRTQNGVDTDDYCVDDNNKVERYLAPFPKNSRMLMIGVGTGREILCAKELGFNVTGITLGSRNVYFGLNYLGLSSDELKEEMNELLPWQALTFDLIAGFQVFEHTIAPLLFLLEMGRVLKIGGTLLLEWPPANEPFSMRDNPHHQICFVPGQAKALFQKAGFKNIEVTYDNGQSIPEEDMWNGNQNKMLVIKGQKSALAEVQPFVREIWSMQE